MKKYNARFEKDEKLNIEIVEKVLESFDALEETLGKLNMEESLFITYIAKKAFAKKVCDKIKTIDIKH